ncbi:MAG: histidine kinase N-terminal 7TM domain-containing protein, partial [Patescibacteria group bacterium]
MTLSLLSIFAFFIFFTCFILAIVVLSFGKLKLHKLWALFNIANAWWGACLFFIGNKNLNAENAYFLWKLGHVGAMFISVVFLHTVLELCKITKRKILYMFYILDSIFFILLNLNGKMGFKLEYMFNSFYYARAESFTYVIATLLWFAAILYGFLLLLREYLKTTGSKKNQLGYLLGPIFIAFLGGCSHFFPVYGLKIYPFNIIMVFYPLIVSYAILKHRLLDIKVAFTRGAILILVYIAIVGMPLLLIATSKPWLETAFKANWYYPPLILYTVLALLAPYFYLRLQAKAEQKRMLQQLRLHQSLKAASKTTIEVQSIDKLAKIIPRYLLRLYKKLGNNIPHISLFLKDREEKIYKIKSSVGTNKLDGKMTISLESYLVKWFTVIRYILVENGVLKEKEAEVLV